MDFLYCVNDGKRGRSWMEYSIKSLLEHTKGHAVRIFVASDAPYAAPGVTWIDARSYIDRFGMKKISEVTKLGMRPSPMQIFRLAAPCLKELDSVDTLLYIDIDTEIVGNGLETLPWSGFHADVMALYEHSQHGKESTEIMLKNGELLEMMADSTKERLKAGGYFNSGVMLMDLNHMRSQHPKWAQELPHIIQMAVKHHRCVVDQDICNVILTAKPLDPKFNVMPDTDVCYNVPAPCLLHYANMSKYHSSVYPPPEVRAKIF